MVVVKILGNTNTPPEKYLIAQYGHFWYQSHPLSCLVRPSSRHTSRGVTVGCCYAAGVRTLRVHSTHALSPMGDGRTRPA